MVRAPDGDRPRRRGGCHPWVCRPPFGCGRRGTGEAGSGRDCDWGGIVIGVGVAVERDRREKGNAGSRGRWAGWRAGRVEWGWAQLTPDYRAVMGAGSPARQAARRRSGPSRPSVGAGGRRVRAGRGRRSLASSPAGSCARQARASPRGDGHTRPGACRRGRTSRTPRGRGYGRAAVRRARGLGDGWDQRQAERLDFRSQPLLGLEDDGPLCDFIGLETADDGRSGGHAYGQGTTRGRRACRCRCSSPGR